MNHTRIPSQITRDIKRVQALSESIQSVFESGGFFDQQLERDCIRHLDGMLLAHNPAGAAGSQAKNFRCDRAWLVGMLALRQCELFERVPLH